jgi:hypothetical protein
MFYLGWIFIAPEGIVLPGASIKVHQTPPAFI